MTASSDNVDILLRILRARDIALGHADDPPIFNNSEHMQSTIDAIELGAAQWSSVAFQYTGEPGEALPKWKCQPYVFHYQHTLETFKAMLASPDFEDKIDYVPFEEYVPSSNGERRVRRFCNHMSGQWAYQKAVSAFELLHVTKYNVVLHTRQRLQRKTRTIAAQCLSPSFLAPTRQQ